jgi:hypothetical protein
MGPPRVSRRSVAQLPGNRKGPPTASRDAPLRGIGGGMLVQQMFIVIMFIVIVSVTIGCLLCLPFFMLMDDWSLGGGECDMTTYESPALL